MTDWKEALGNLDLTTSEGLETAKRLFVAHNRKQQIDSLKNQDETEDILETFGAIREYNDFIDQSERSRPEIIKWEDIPDIERREWLIPSWLPANTVTMFTGEGGAGKSWLTLQAVCQIVLGYNSAYLDPDFKREADRLPPRNVIFATYEDEPAEIKRRLQALASGMPWIYNAFSIIKQHLHIVDMRGIGSVWGPGIGKHIQNTGDLLSAGEDLRQICEDKQARLLVMDPLSGAFGGNENDRTAVYDFVSSFRGWGDQAQCAMLVIGHLPKSQEGKAAGFSGSTAWEASARSMWMLSKKSFTQGEGKQAETRHYWALEHTKANYALLQSEIPLIRINGYWTKASDREDAADALNKIPQEETHDEADIPEF